MPPILNAPIELEESIYALNDLLLASEVPLIDFTTDMLVPDYRPDGLHFSASGQTKRAAAATAVLWPTNPAEQPAPLVVDG